VHFAKAAEIVRRGDFGKITFVRCWNYGLGKPEGIGDPPDQEPPATLDWDMWLGPAPRRAYNPNRLGVDPEVPLFFQLPLALGLRRSMMTDWGVPLARHRSVGLRRADADCDLRMGRQILCEG
jgi:hypothetical protein